MRGYWVRHSCPLTVEFLYLGCVLGHRGERNSSLCRVRRTVAHRQAISTSELGCGTGSIQVRLCVVLLVARDANIRTAFEFSKRKFSQTYGPDLPVWALLASGSTGGVRLYLLTPLERFASIPLQIAYWLSSYPLGNVATLSTAIPWEFNSPPPERRHQVARAASHNPSKRNTCAVHRE
jgi:hypothetical protein